MLPILYKKKLSKIFTLPKYQWFMNPYKTWTGPMKLKSIVDSLKTLCHVCLSYRYIEKRDGNCLASSRIMKQLTAEPFLFSDACSVPSFTHIECSRIHISPFQMMWWDSSGRAVSTLCFWVINHFKVCSPNLETKLVEEHFLDNPHFCVTVQHHIGL
jgi:hypothetical protein